MPNAQPGIVRDQSGRSVWSIPIEELEALLDVHGPSGTGDVPYIDSSGNELFIVLAGTEDGIPRELNESRRAAASTADHALCEIFRISIPGCALSRHHIGAHLLFDSSWTQRPACPCGFCGVRPAVPFTTVPSLVSGCTTGLAKSGSSSFKHQGSSCKLVGEVYYSYGHAVSSTEAQPCTNIPMISRCALASQPSWCTSTPWKSTGQARMAAKHATHRSVVLTTRRLGVTGDRSQGPAGDRLVTGGVGGSMWRKKAPFFCMILLSHKNPPFSLNKS